MINILYNYEVAQYVSFAQSATPTSADACAGGSSGSVSEDSTVRSLLLLKRWKGQEENQMMGQSFQKIVGEMEGLTST